MSEFEKASDQPGARGEEMADPMPERSEDHEERIGHRGIGGVPLSELFGWRVLPWAGGVVGIAAVLGALLGLLWPLLGPHVVVVMTQAGPTLKDPNTESFAGGDARYALLTALAGIALGIGAWLLRRWRGPVLVVAVALGSLTGAWITWKLGEQAGNGQYETLLRNAAAGREFARPMTLRAEGLVFLQAIVAVMIYMVLASWSRFPDLGATPENAEHHAAPENGEDRAALDSSENAAASENGEDRPALEGGDNSVSPGGGDGSVSEHEPTTELSSSPSEPAAPPAAPAPPAAGTASSPPA